MSPTFQPPSGRPREFDPDDAVRDPLEVFRQRRFALFRSLRDIAVDVI